VRNVGDINGVRPNTSSKLLVDNVQISAAAAVPEPTTWGLMIAGFGLAGAALRSRKRSTLQGA
jgi:hypothetical protein